MSLTGGVVDVARREVGAITERLEVELSLVPLAEIRRAFARIQVVARSGKRKIAGTGDPDIEDGIRLEPQLRIVGVIVVLFRGRSAPIETS